MSDRPRWQAHELDAAMGGGKAPRELDREGRVRLLAEFTEAALAGRTPTWESIMFVCGGLSSWLAEGGDLCRDYWRIVKPKSHHTPRFIYHQIRAHQDERQGDDAQG